MQLLPHGLYWKRVKSKQTNKQTKQNKTNQTNKQTKQNKTNKQHQTTMSQNWVLRYLDAQY